MIIKFASKQTTMIDKVKEKLLADLKKANKERKLKLAQNFGFSTVEDYKNFLEAIITPKVENTVKPKIHIVNILDASGSMQGDKYNNSKEGVLMEISTLSKDNTVDYTYSLVEFVQTGKIVEHCLMSDFPKKVNFNGAHGGNTPLYITVYQTIEKLQQSVSKEDKVLIKVFTDGGNNTDSDYISKCKTLIEKVSKENFTVTFVGTDRDIEAIKKQVSVDDSNTLKVANTGEGFRTAFSTANQATMDYSAKVKRGEDVLTGFYKKAGTL